MAISNESNTYELAKPPFRKGVAMAIGFSATLARPSRDEFSTILSIKRRESAAAISHTSSHHPQTHSIETACDFTSSCNWLETALHGSEVQATLVVDYDCCDQSLDN